MSEELKACPFCGGRAEIRDYRYQGTGASGMETPNPYGACAKGCVSMKPVPCDDSPYGRKTGATTYKKARAIAVANWNTRTPAPSDAARTEGETLIRCPHGCQHAEAPSFDRMGDGRVKASCFVCKMSGPACANEHDAAQEWNAICLRIASPTTSSPETAAVEDLDALDELRLIDAALRNKGMRDWQRVIVVRTALPSIRAALTRLRATTTARDAHCSNCGRPWTASDGADNKCCWEESKCARASLPDAARKETT